MNKLYRISEVSANVGIVVVATVLSIVAIKTYLIPTASPLPPTDKAITDKAGRVSDATLHAGMKIQVPNINWQENGRTLILALSSTCHFCTESAPLYQTLAEAKGSTKLIAVLPQPVEQGKEYMRQLKVPVDDVRQVPSSSLKLEGTPTIVLVDNQGTVVDFWIGKLPANQEAEVLNAM